MIFDKEVLRLILMARSVLRLASETWPKMPTKEDTLVGKIVKTLSVVDSLYTSFGGKSNELSELIARLNLQEKRNRFFVEIFFETGMTEFFKNTRSAMGPNMDMYTIYDGAGGRLMFTEYTRSWTGGSPQRNDTFYYTAEFDFGKVTTFLWEKYTDGLYLTMERGPHNTSIKLCDVPPLSSEVVSAKAAERLSELVVEHKSFLEENISRSYLFAGPPGTGKTSMVMRIARSLGGRLLKVDADAIGIVGAAHIGFLLDVLEPDVLVVDDVDHMSRYSDTSGVLFFMEYIKAKRPQTSVFMTANYPQMIPDALRRRGRIDKHLIFDMPDAEERRELTQRLLEQHRVKLEDKDLERFLQALDGLSQADVSVLCEDLRVQTLDSVIKGIEGMRALEKKINKDVKEGLMPD